MTSWVQGALYWIEISSKTTRGNMNVWILWMINSNMGMELTREYMKSENAYKGWMLV